MLIKYIKNKKINFEKNGKLDILLYLKIAAE